MTPRVYFFEGNTIYVTEGDEIKKISFDGKVSSWISFKDFPENPQFLNRQESIDRNTFIYVSDSGVSCGNGS